MSYISTHEKQELINRAGYEEEDQPNNWKYSSVNSIKSNILFVVSIEIEFRLHTLIKMRITLMRTKYFNKVLLQ
jgi:hypothetical protein